MDEFVGNAGKPRMLAALLDNLAGCVVAITISANVPGLGNEARAVVLVVSYLAYFFAFESIWACSPFKRVFGLRVVRSDGQRAGWKEATIRTLLRVIEVNPILFGAIPGALVVAFSRRKQRLGDILAGTVVTTQGNAHTGS